MADEEASNIQSDENRDDGHPPARKRQRVRLSCLECRRRKLSCSRELPCDRCIKSGTPERCSYESRGPGPTAGSVGDRSSLSLSSAPGRNSVGQTREASGPHRDVETSLAIRDAAKDHDRLQKLELEVAQLRSALNKQSTSIDGSTAVASPSTTKDIIKESPSQASQFSGPPWLKEGCGDGLEAKFLKCHNFKARYFGSYNAWSVFNELSGIQPFMKETAEEWLRPLNISKKDRKKRKEEREKRFLEPDPELDALLPPKEEVDPLVEVYIDQFERLHRIVHIPTFRREYEAFWDSTKPNRYAAFTALLLAMLSVSSCVDMQTSFTFVGVKSTSYQTAERWVKACDSWLDRQSQKHRRLIHYQIMCMLWLAKRVNVIKKKRFWTTAGSLVRDGIIIGLHQDPDNAPSTITPYYREMRRRLWATIMEFDIQVSFEQGVPTLLNQIYNEAGPPRNIDDDSFDENSEELPAPRLPEEYTVSSYQNLARHSLQTRLELNRLLTGPIGDLDWDQVTRCADMIHQELDALPSWDMDDEKKCSDKCLLAHALLHLQLKQYLIPLYQPFLKLSHYSSKYQAAEFMYYNTARDIVLMHDRLYQKGIRVLYFLRDDFRGAVASLCSATIRQPRGSTSLIMSSSQDTIKLIEKCLAIQEDRIIRCGNNDPWGYSSMCASLGLLEIHLGTKGSEAAKAAAAERFISLHYKLLAYQIPQFPNQQDSITPQTSQEPVHRAKSITPFIIDANPGMQLGPTPAPRESLPLAMPWLLPGGQQDMSQTPGQTPAQTPGANPDFDLFGMDLNDLWSGGGFGHQMDFGP